MSHPEPDSYLTPKCEVRPRHIGHGRAVYALQPIEAGELVSLWSGRIVSQAQIEADPAVSWHSVQVEEGFYLVPPSEHEPPDYINHACEPNLGLSGQLALVAMRVIAPGEEVTFDYAMTDGTPYDEFDCECGAPGCRGRVTGDDWRQPALWEKYAGYFMPYLQRRIERLKK